MSRPSGRSVAPGIATLIALTLFALPPIITNTYVAVREVAGEVKESARGMGMTGWQQFRRVELPLATPLIAGGVRLALVQVWATATIAALVAGPGLGRLITDGFANSNYGKGIAGCRGCRCRGDDPRGARDARTASARPGAQHVTYDTR